MAQIKNMHMQSFWLVQNPVHKYPAWECSCLSQHNCRANAYKYDKFTSDSGQARMTTNCDRLCS